MKPTEVITQLRTLLGMEVQLEEMQLSNGTVLEAEEFAEGKDVFIKTEDEKVALPEGIYDLEDGRKLIVVEEGVIDEIKQESETEEEMAENKDVVLEEKEDDKQEMEYATKQELGEVKEMVEEIKAMIEGKDKPEEEEAMSAEVVAEEVSEEQELKEELSKPAAKAIRHSPEAKTKKSMNLYAQRRATSTFDRVLEGISNISKR